MEFTGSKTNFILPESVNGLAHACGFLRCGQTVAKCRNRLSWFLVWKLPQRTDILYFLKTASRSAFQKKRSAPYLYSTRGFVQMLVNAIPQLAIPADTYYHYHVNHTPSVLHPGSGYSNEAWHTAIWTPLCCYMKFSPGGGVGTILCIKGIIRQSHNIFQINLSQLVSPIHFSILAPPHVPEDML